MLEIKPIEDKNEQETLCRLCGIEYREELFAYKAYEDGKLFAAAQFDICGEYAVIYGMSQVTGSADDFEGMFILGRAVLNFLDLCGVKEAVYRVTDEHSEKLAKLVGFRKVGEEYRISLVGLFTSPCSHGNGYKAGNES